MARKIPLKTEGRPMGRIVKLPVMTRFVTFVGLPAILGKITLRVVDGIGLYVHHNFKEVPTDDQIRHQLIGGQRGYVEVEADSVAEALLKFPDVYPGAVTGVRALALELKPAEHWPITIYPHCSRMHETTKGYRVCGKPMPDGLNGEYGGCILDGCDPPYNCPIEEFLEEKGTPHHSI